MRTFWLVVRCSLVVAVIVAALVGLGVTLFEESSPEARARADWRRSHRREDERRRYDAEWKRLEREQPAPEATK